MFVNPTDLMHDSERVDRLTGDYIGIVVDNVDPSNYGRVKIRIPEVHGTIDDISDADLPYAIRIDPVGFGSSSEVSSYSVPVIGSEVMVRFYNNDIYSPMYYGRPYNSNSITGQGNGKYIFKDPHGNSINIDYENKTADIDFDASFTINITGNVTMNVTGSVNSTIGGNSTSIIEGNMTSTVGGNLSCASTGSIEAQASSATITAPAISLVGNTSIDGTLSVTQALTALSVVETATSVGLSTHTHSVPNVQPGVATLPTTTGTG